MNTILTFVTVLAWIIAPLALWQRWGCVQILARDKIAEQNGNRIGANGWDRTWQRIALERKGPLTAKRNKCSFLAFIAIVWLCVRYFA